MSEAFIASITAVERGMINMRTSGGRAFKAAQGGYSGSRPPYGYEVRNSKLIINEDEAELVSYTNGKCMDLKDAKWIKRNRN